jgi:hypothetical protein
MWKKLRIPTNKRTAQVLLAEKATNGSSVSQRVQVLREYLREIGHIQYVSMAG